MSTDAPQPAQVLPHVRTLLGHEVEEVRDLTVVPIAYRSVNPITIGLYRISGAAVLAGRADPWSLVLKICRPPSPELAARIPLEIRGLMLDTFRWDREALAYASGLLAERGSGLVAPRCLAVERDATEARIWMEDVADERPAWDLSRYAVAARHLGRWNGMHADAERRPAEWLSRAFLRTWWQWLRPGVERLLGDDAVWEQERVRAAFPSALRTALGGIVGSGSRLFAVLDGLPRSVAHLDAFRANLFARDRASGEETVAIDWSFTGVAPLGAEASQLTIASVFYHGEPVAIHDLEAAVWDSYLGGLREAGWSGDERAVRLGYVGSGIARWSFPHLTMLRAVDDLERQVAIEREQHVDFATVLERLAARMGHLIELAREFDRLLA